MKLLRNIGVWTLAGGVALAAGSVALAQSKQGSSGSSSNGGAGSGSIAGAQSGGGSYGGGSSSGSTSGARSGSVGMGPVSPSTMDEMGAGDLPINPQMEHDQAKLRNLERQKQLVADTQKLVALANQLQMDVGKSNKDMLSMDVVRKAEEIEKLAHTVRDKMKNAN
jgi:hypothetical protein